MTIILIILLVSISGCFESTKNPNEKNLSPSDRFVGDWKTENGLEMKIYPNGKCFFGGSEGTWEIKDELLLITLPFTGGKNTLGWSYNFSNNNTTLSLTNARDEVYLFQKQ